MNCTVKPFLASHSARNTGTFANAQISFSEMTEDELIRACQAEKKGAIDALLKRHRTLLKAMIHRRFPELSDISDIVQEAHIRIWKSIGKLRNSSAFKRWLSQIVTNLCFDELRRKSRCKEMLWLDEPDESQDGYKSERVIADTSDQPDTNLQRKELGQELKDALAKIPPEFRQSVLLREVDGLSYEEIAVITNSQLGTVKSRISRARTKVQEQMEAYIKDAA
ncbi:MAG: RNA polymerase subunit sigma [Candidatus Melainabacteria bacterium]|nr:MAG: RNA polymerase subunit sigma [Candidatus Melainabacteria bacterium]